MLTISESKTIMYNSQMEFAERLPQTLYSGWKLAKVKIEKSNLVKAIYTRDIAHDDKEVHTYQM